MKLTGFKLILVIILFAAALSVIAIFEFTEIMPSDYTGGIISRLFAAACFIAIAAILHGVKLRVNPYEGAKDRKLRALLIAAMFVVCVNNAPLIGLLSGNVVITASADRIFLYLFYCFSVALFEEVLFRCVLLETFFVIAGDNIRNKFLALFISALIFSLSHFDGFNFNVMIQMGYTFLLGVGWGYIAMKEGHILWGIAMHFLYNAGGMAAQIAEGNRWDTATVIITALLSVAVGAVYLYSMLKDIINSNTPPVRPA